MTRVVERWRGGREEFLAAAVAGGLGLSLADAEALGVYVAARGMAW